jgi:ABC-type proline/glycine betaine transport system ATPase subunit
MFLMRGLPGSGKSTLVKILKQIYSKSVAVCSADNFFLDEQGVYNFNRDRISEAHRVCQQKAEEACRYSRDSPERLLLSSELGYCILEIMFSQ